jgi:hypothetical protein
MDKSPFRERRFAPADVRRILRRAVDLAEKDADTPAAERPLTQEELVRLGGELGLPATAVQGAITGASSPAEAKASFWKPPRRLVLEEELSGELPASLHEDVVDAIQAFMGDAGSAQIVGKTLTWTPTPMTQGQSRQLTVAIRTRDGKTRLRIEENLQNVYLGLHLGLGLGLGIGGGMGVFTPMALVAHSVLLGIGLPALVVIASLLLARTIYQAVSRRRARQLTELRTRLREVTREGIAGVTTRSARKRIAVGADAEDADAQAAEEAEAEAEAEVKARAGRRS